MASAGWCLEKRKDAEPQYSPILRYSSQGARHRHKAKHGEHAVLSLNSPQILNCELSAARYFTPSQPAGRPAKQLAGRPATNQAPAGRPAGRHRPRTSWPAVKTKPQLAGRPDATNQEPASHRGASWSQATASQPAIQRGSQPVGRPAGGPKTKPGEWHEWMQWKKRLT